MKEARNREIAEAIGTDEQTVRTIAEMTLDEAFEYFTANGYSFTKEDLSGFAKAVQSTVQSGELSETDLENTAGGFALTAALAWTALSLLAGNIGCFWAAGALNRAGSRRYRR